MGLNIVHNSILASKMPNWRNVTTIFSTTMGKYNNHFLKNANDILYYCHHIGNKYFVTGSHKQCKTEQMGLVDSDYSSLRSDHSTTNSEVGSIVSNTSGSVVSNTSLSSSFFSQRKHYILLTLMFKDKRVMLDELTMQYNLPYIRNIFFHFILLYS